MLMERINHPFTQWRWFALTVPPQRERTVATILGQPKAGGFATFVPVRTEFRLRKSRYSRKKVETTYPLMPRYVFVGMNDRTGGWAHIFNIMDRDQYDPRTRRLERRSIPFAQKRATVLGVVGMAGQPVEIPVRNLIDLRRRSSDGAFTAPNAHAFMQTHREVAVGDVAELLDAPVPGMTGRVIEIDEINGRAMVEQEFFGSLRRVEVALDRVAAPAY